MSTVKTIHVPHLGGIDAAYHMPHPLDPSMPTAVLVNSFTTTSELYKDQFGNEKLTDAMNLIAIEPLGHGQTRTKIEDWTYWDTAHMNIQVLSALGVSDKFFVLGTSQGGWITVCMALLAPEKVAGIIPLGTSMDSESERARKLSCWDAPGLLTPFIDQWTTEESTPEFELGDEYCGALLFTGFGPECPSEKQDFWIKTIKGNYKGDDGRRRVRMAAINLRDRDSLHGRLSDVRCPVLWLHGTADVVYSSLNAQEEIKLFENSANAELRIVEGGQHFLNSTHPEVVSDALLEFVKKYGS